MKRLTIALAAMGLIASCNVFAAYPANTDPTLVAIPQLPGGLVFGLTGIYMQPSASNGDLDWAGLNNITGVPSNSTSNLTLQQVDPGWSFGGGGNIGYIFPGTGNDINLSYIHLNTSDNDIGSSAFTDTNFLIPIDAQIDTAVDGSTTAEYSLDQLDLTFGQFVDVGCRLVLHPFAGVRLASISRDLYSDYSIPSGFSPIILSAFDTVDESSNYSGIGPLAGIDVSYYILNGIGVVGHFASGLLVGSINSSLDDTLTQTITGLPQSVATLSTNVENTRRIVPVVDAALGLDYTWLFNNASNSDLTLEVGYKVSNYFDAIDNINFDAELGNTTISTSDFNLSGIYATLTLHV